MATNPERIPYSDDSSEDIHILSSNSDIVPENESVNQDCDAHNIEPELIGSGMSHEMSVNDFIYIYGREFYNANQNFVDDFLNQLHHRRDLFKSLDTAQPQKYVHVICLQFKMQYKTLLLDISKIIVYI